MSLLPHGLIVIVLTCGIQGSNAHRGWVDKVPTPITTLRTVMLGMELVRRLRQLKGMTQAQFAKHFGVRQAAMSSYESGRRSPNLDQFQDVASQLGYQLALAPRSIVPARDASEQFSRLLYLAVARHLVAYPDAVRKLAVDRLDEQEQRSGAGFYVDRWRQLILPENEVELLMILCIPDPETIGLLSSSPFAGVIGEEERLTLLAESGSISRAE